MIGKRITLHIGAPKSGSTFLQNVMLKNRAGLREQGIAYPHRGTGHPGNAENIDHISRDWLQGHLADCDHLFLSHENLISTAAKARRLARLRDQMGFKLQVLCFLRPFSEMIFADYSQSFKQGGHHAFEGRDFRQFVWKRQKDIQFPRFFRDWLALVPELELASSTEIQQHVQRILGNPHIDWKLPTWRRNPSLPVSHCEAAVAQGQCDTPEIGTKNLMDTGRTRHRIDWIDGVFAPQRSQMIAEFGFDPG